MATMTKQFPDGGNVYVEYDGDGDGKFTVTADENTSTEERSVNITIRTSDGKIAVERTIIQAGAEASDYVAGDICFYDSEKGAKVIVPYATWNGNKSGYPASRYTPIGVVAIPSSHDVYGTGECAVVSLKEMNYSTPDSGGTAYQSMYWGQYNIATGLKDYTCSVVCGDVTDPKVEATGTADYSDGLYIWLPTDELAGRGYELTCPTDPEAYYNGGWPGYSCHAAPSPYLEDGSRNPAYYQTASPSSDENCLSDFDGKGNSEVLCNLATAQSDWKTASTITNSASSGAAYSPAACCCWRYHTDGTAQGDWYLPACGELGYMIARLEKISDTIEALMGYYGSTIGVRIDDYNNAYWSSTEFGSSDAWYVNTVSAYEGILSYGSKNGGGYVRAFLRVSLAPN